MARKLTTDELEERKFERLYKIHKKKKVNITIDEKKLETINGIVGTDDYRLGVLDTYINIYGASEGTKKYLQDKYGQNFEEILKYIEEDTEQEK